MTALNKIYRMRSMRCSGPSRARRSAPIQTLRSAGKAGEDWIDEGFSVLPRDHVQIDKVCEGIKKEHLHDLIMLKAKMQEFVDTYGKQATVLRLGEVLESIVNTPPNFVPTETECANGMGAILIFSVAQTRENKYSLENLPEWTENASLTKELQALISLAIGKIKLDDKFMQIYGPVVEYLDSCFGR